ncbi:hypothetical protein T484DRAFT_1781569, partial [Baffinella frigidus]
MVQRAACGVVELTGVGRVEVLMRVEAACGVASTDVLGDAFVARAYDNESEDMERHDFTRMDLEPDAAWFREAARLKHVLVQTRVGVTQDDAVVV